MLLLSIILGRTLGKVGIKVLRLIFKILCKKYVKSNEELADEERKRIEDLAAIGIDVHSNDILTDLKVGPLRDYYKKSMKEYKDFLQF